MRESLYYANQELKRAEHLLYVSLKYTRTGDVIKSLIARLISCFDYIIDGMLRVKEENHEIDKIPEKPFPKIALLKKLYEKDHKMLSFLDFYFLLRKISREKGESRREFRRNLTLTVVVDEKKIEITIDIVGDYYHRTDEFLKFVRDMHILDTEK